MQRSGMHKKKRSRQCLVDRMVMLLARTSHYKLSPTSIYAKIPQYRKLFCVL